eukprot:jgi/Ulvmu1/10367/UM061_0050.1
MALVRKPTEPAITAEEAAQAKVLENDLFGGADTLLQRVAGNATDRATDGTETDDALFRLDETGNEQPIEQAAPEKAAKSQKRLRAPVWVDADTQAIEVDISAAPRLRKLRKDETDSKLKGPEYEERLRTFHGKLHKRTSWAQRRSKKRQTEEEELATAAFTTQVAPLQARSTTGAQAGPLELTRMRDVNVRERNQAVVQSVDWHPNAQLVMTAGYDKRLRLFTVDGVHNPLVQSVFIKDMPVHQAAFAAGGSTVIVSGRRKFFYVWDLEAQRLDRIKGLLGFDTASLETFAVPPPAVQDSKACVAFLGTDGEVGLVSMQSRQLVGTVKMNGQVRSAAFDPTGTELYTGGTDGRVFVWDVRTQRCLHSFVDEGCIKGSALAVSGAAVAAGSASGVVNVFERWRAGGATLQAPAPAPLRALDNLVTTVDTLRFSPDGTMLCMASRMKRDAMRLVHVPSLTVYANWPTSRTPLGHVHCACFSPGGGMLAIGNAKGHVLTYRLHDFPLV